ncbi:MAG: hypothetical protein Q3988_04085 [Gemella sp.]|nr:hypothetical protein [Gemella sp.]
MNRLFKEFLNANIFFVGMIVVGIVIELLWTNNTLIDTNAGFLIDTAAKDLIVPSFPILIGKYAVSVAIVTLGFYFLKKEKSKLAVSQK